MKLTPEEVLAIANKTLETSALIQVDAVIMAAIALVESSGDPKAFRYEPHLAEASAGLTQVLMSTAKWLASDMGYSEFGQPKDEEDLYNPQAAMYFCGGKSASPSFA